MSTKNVSILQIAERCGVSHVTVSRILGGKACLHNVKTVKRIHQVAREMGYRPNILAQSMQTGKTRMVGVVMREAHGSWFSEIQNGIHQELIDAEYLPLTLTLHPDGPPGSELLDHMLNRRVEGVILWEATEEMVADVVTAGVPLATLDTPNECAAEFDFVGTDERTGAELAAQHLLELGHRRFATETYEGLTTATERCHAFAASVAQIPGTSCTACTCPYTAKDKLKSSIGKALTSQERPTAIFAGSDKIAVAVYEVAATLGISIPRDLSVVGYANLDFAALVSPPLTTIRQDPQEIGKRAASLLLDRIEGSVIDCRPRRIRLEPDLVVRGSTATAA